mmetsp:Transcript_50904/g.115645  ORF Transcript_50904/g.115645 Transcript_50904/m.115645 type:complete len:223 (-) Transcript_50904:180-848(-)
MSAIRRAPWWCGLSSTFFSFFFFFFFFLFFSWYFLLFFFVILCVCRRVGGKETPLFFPLSSLVLSTLFPFYFIFILLGYVSVLLSLFKVRGYDAAEGRELDGPSLLSLKAVLAQVAGLEAAGATLLVEAPAAPVSHLTGQRAAAAAAARRPAVTAHEKVVAFVVNRVDAEAEEGAAAGGKRIRLKIAKRPRDLFASLEFPKGGLPQGVENIGRGAPWNRPGE